MTDCSLLGLLGQASGNEVGEVLRSSSTLNNKHYIAD